MLDQIQGFRQRCTDQQRAPICYRCSKACNVKMLGALRGERMYCGGCR